LSMECKKIRVIDEKGSIMVERRLPDKLWIHILRLFELTESDDETMQRFTEVVKNLEDTKRKLACKVATKVKEKELHKHLEDALMALPNKALNEIDQTLGEFKLEREPGGDCLYLTAGSRKHLLHL